jgi:hypothetical protein
MATANPSLKVVPSKPRKARPSARRSGRPVGIVDQVRNACRRENRLATLLGALLGGFVPLATFMVTHRELDLGAALWTQPLALLVLGGLVYSARTVYEWARLAFVSPMKALGFTVLLEGVMTCSGVEWLSYAALGYLIGVNAIAAGVTLAVGGTR